MLKLTWYCSSCNKGGDVDDPSVIAGQCPLCGRHHGEVEYECDMSRSDFMKEIAAMSPAERKKYEYAIQIGENQFVNS